MQKALEKCKQRCKREDLWWPMRPAMFGFREYRYASCIEECSRIKEKIIHLQSSNTYKLDKTATWNDTSET